MSRISLEELYLKILDVIKLRSTCPRRATAAIITDVDGRVLATGYNGVPRGVTHCTDKPCAGAGDPAGDSSRCLAVHAEANALLQCRDLQTRAHTIYTSVTPCFACAKLLLNTPIRTIICADWYPDARALQLFRDQRVSVLVSNPMSRELQEALDAAADAI